MLVPVNAIGARVCNCEACGTEVVSKKKGPRKRFCRRCIALRERAADRTRQRGLWRSRNPRCNPIGSALACIDCGREFIKTSGPLTRCHGCRKTYAARWFAHRRRTDPTFNLLDRLRRAINASLGNGVKRRRPWESLVGYTTQELVTHLERQFPRGMSWDNRARWHIDHIVPLASFKFESAEDEAFKAAWALTNLRPLWATENQRKHATRAHLL